MERKNFIKSVKLHKFCKSDATHPQLAYIHFENGYAYATESHILVRAKISDICTLDNPEMLEKLDGKNLHLKQFQSLLELDEITDITDDSISAMSYADNHYEMSFKFNHFINHMGYERVFKDFHKSKKNPVRKIAFEPRLIALVYDALPEFSSQGIIFEFGKNKNSAVLMRNPRIQMDIQIMCMPTYSE